MGLRCALVGFGRVAELAHVPALAEHGVEVAAVCESDPGRLLAARAVLPQARAYARFDRLLEDENGLDFIDIATPPFLHSAQALAAVRAGFHVLCEKPLALAPDELETLKRSAAMTGRSIFTVHNWAHSPQWLKMFALADSGAIGSIQHAETHVLRTQPAASAIPGDWRREPSKAGGGILVDHGWHNLYLLHRLIKAAPNRVNARLSPGIGHSVDDEATLFMEFPSATALMRLSWCGTLRRNAALVLGSAGAIEMRDDEIVVTTAAGQERFSFPEALSAGSAHPAWLSAMLPDFFLEISDPARRGRNLEEAAFCLGVIHRAYQSVRYGRNPLRAALSPQEKARR